MFQPIIYKSFNSDLKHLSNNQLLYHWKNIGLNENRIFSFESFFERYPEYRENYLSDSINDKINRMVKYHYNKNLNITNNNPVNNISLNLQKKKINKKILEETIIHIIILGSDIKKIKLSIHLILQLNKDKNIKIEFHSLYKKDNKIFYFKNSLFDKEDIILECSKDLFLEIEASFWNIFFKIFTKNEWVFILKEGNSLNNYFFDILLNDIKNRIIIDEKNNIPILHKIDIVLFRNIDSNNTSKIFSSIDNNFILNKDSLKKIYFSKNWHTLNSYFSDRSDKEINILISSFDNKFILNEKYFLFYSEILLKNMCIVKEYNINNNLINNIHIYIINLDNRKDRYENCIHSLNISNINNYERFSAIIPTPEQINNKLLNPYKVWKKNNKDYFKGALGCKMSHLQVLKTAQKDSDKKYILILEDDAIFDNFNLDNLIKALSYLENNNIDYDIFYLSLNLLDKTDAEKITDNVLKVKNGLTTTAQLFNRNKIQKIIDLIENSEEEIDNTYNLLENKYCLYPMCVYQQKSYSNINNTVTDYGFYHTKFKY